MVALHRHEGMASQRVVGRVQRLLGAVGELPQPEADFERAARAVDGLVVEEEVLVVSTVPLGQPAPWPLASPIPSRAPASH